MTQAAILQLIADGIATALEAQAATMENTNRNVISNYKEFMSCQPSYFNVHTAQYWDGNNPTRITWTELKRLLTNKYCPRTEVKKMEDEFYNLAVKGNDLKLTLEYSRN
ncbi:hypothetical protein Tco_1507296 [Tanacetum coccineum]